MAQNFRSPIKVLRRLKVMPSAAFKIKSWPRFVYNYALGLVPKAPYVFRDGTKINIGRGVDHVPLIEVFLKEDYGRVPDGAIVVDIGANIGSFAVYAATTAQNARIYAYEPMGEFFRLMEENIRLNGLEQIVTCFACAVGADGAMRDLYFEGPDLYFPTFLEQTDSRGKFVTVACTTLPDILESNNLACIDLLKMDCEGAEYEILYNTSRSCFEQIGEIRMEYHNIDGDNRNVAALEEFLRSRGFSVILRRETSPNVGNLWVTKHG